MPDNSPQNLRRTEDSLSGEEIAALNGIQSGLGNKLHRLFSSLGQAVSAQAGHKGTVGIKKQEARDVKGVTAPALLLDEDRVGGVADPVNDLDAVNLRTLRRYIEQIPDVGEGALTPAQVDKQVCRPTALSNMKTAITGMTTIYATEAQREFVYVAGEDNGTPVFQVYRILIDANHTNEMRLIASINQSEAFQRMILQGHFIFGCRTNGGSQDLTVIDVKKPHAPVEVALFNVGATCKGLHAQGRFVYVACVGVVKIIDASLPDAPVAKGSAS